MTPRCLQMATADGPGVVEDMHLTARIPRHGLHRVQSPSWFDKPHREDGGNGYGR